MQTAKVGDTAQWISKVDGTPHLGDVIEAGETYADVQWRQNGRVERIQFSHPDGVAFSEAPAPRCDAGGTYWYPDLEGPAVYEPPCTQPPTHRFRSPGMVDGHWGHRCAQHVAWLDRDICTVEPPTDPAALCLRAGDHWPHMTAVSPDCRTLPTDQQ